MEKSNFSWDKERSQISKIQAEEGNLMGVTVSPSQQAAEFVFFPPHHDKWGRP